MAVTVPHRVRKCCKVTQSVLENAIASITHPNIQIVEGKDWKLYLRFEQPKVTAVEIYQNYLTA